MKYWIAMIGIAALLCSGCQKVSKALKEATGKKAETSGSATASGSTEIRQIVGAGDFDSFVNQKGRVTVIDFYADWCGPCRVLGPVLEKVAGEFGGQVAIGKVNVDKNRDLAAKWAIRAIPDIRIFRDGKQVDAFVGNLPESQVRQRLERQVSQLPPPGEKTAGATPESNSDAKKEPSITPESEDWLPPGVERR